MALTTNGFQPGERLNHFDRHRLEHRWSNQFEYEEDADNFLTKTRTATLLECVRRSGARIRFDTVTCEFGIRSADNHIVTYFYRIRGGLEYFEQECAQ